MKNLFTWKYWFSVNPEQLSALGFAFLIGVTVLFFAVGIASLVGKRRRGIYRGFFDRFYDFSIANFILGLVFLFFNYENIPFFVARFWLIIWLLGAGAWLFFIIRRLKEIPAKKKALEAEQERKKYLP